MDHSLRIEDFDGLEPYLTACVGHERFRSVHLGAYERWSEASAILYRDSTQESLLAAGQEAHEALQEFARAVSEPPHSATPDTDSAEARSPVWGPSRRPTAHSWETLAASCCSGCSTTGAP